MVGCTGLDVVPVTQRTVIEGKTYERVYACELERFDKTLLNGMVFMVERFVTHDGREQVKVEFHDSQFVNGRAVAYYKADTTLLTEVKTW